MSLADTSRVVKRLGAVANTSANRSCFFGSPMVTRMQRSIGGG